MRKLLAAMVLLLAAPPAAAGDNGKQDFILRLDVDPTTVRVQFRMPGQWQVTPEEAAEAKAALLKSYPASDRYLRQYVGGRYRVVVKDGRSFVEGPIPDGEPLVLIRGFDDASDAVNPETEQVLIADGGRCCFEAYYSLRERKIVYFSFHGYA
jgi:hypothetical protein